MNKFILLALVATAYARECATAEELGNADFTEYKLKYVLTEYYSNDAILAKGQPIGFDVKDKTCGKDCWNIQMKSGTFKIKGSLDAANVSTGFRIYSKNKKQVLSLNQGQGGYGYYMYDKKDEYIDTGRYSHYTLMNYDYADKRLSQATKSLGVNSGNGTLISRTGTFVGANETKFCFVEVGILDETKTFAKYIFNGAKEISKEIFYENMETLEDAHPTLYSALTAEGDESLTEKVQALAKKELEKELKNQLDKALIDGKHKLKEQLESKMKDLKGLTTKQQAIEMWNSLQGKGEEDKGERKSEDDKETQCEKEKVHTNDEDDQKPKKGENKKDVRDNVLGGLKGQNNVLGDLKGQNVLGDLKGQNVLGDLKQNNFLGDLKGQNVLGDLKGQNNELAKGITSAKKDDSSVQTPFALSALILLLLVN